MPEDWFIARRTGSFGDVEIDWSAPYEDEMADESWTSVILSGLAALAAVSVMILCLVLIAR